MRGTWTAFERVVDASAAAHGTVVGDVIDDNPLAHSTLPDRRRRSRRATRSPTTGSCATARAQNVRTGLVTSAQQILAETPRSPGTDIQDGVSLAKRVFDAYPDGLAALAGAALGHGRAHARVNVGGVGFGDRAATDSLDRLAAQGSIPDLTGVRVYVVGAGVVGSSELPAARILAIQRFWLGFFADGRRRSDRGPVRRRARALPLRSCRQHVPWRWLRFPDPGRAALDRAARGLARRGSSGATR